MKSKLGAQRFLLETISHKAVVALARKNGWEDDGEGLREFVEPEDVAVHTAFRTLAEAQEAAKRHLSSGDAFYGCALIDRQVYQQPHDDRGNLVRVPPTWETEQTFEVAMDGETIDVAA